MSKAAYGATKLELSSNGVLPWENTVTEPKAMSDQSLGDNQRGYLGKNSAPGAGQARRGDRAHMKTGGKPVLALITSMIAY